MLSRRSAIKGAGLTTATMALLGKNIAFAKKIVAEDSKMKVIGPISGCAHGWIFGKYLGDIAALGYVEEEYFLEGEAAWYRPKGELGVDGKWEVEPAGVRPFKTRIVVQRPKDKTRFNRTVVVEWNNVSSGFDIMVHAREALYAAGFVYVGVSAQTVGVQGVGANRRGLVQWDAERYGTLVHPGDSCSYDIFSQAGRAVGPHRSRDEIDPLHGLAVKNVIATGASQSAARLVGYANAIQRRDRVFDAIVPGVLGGTGTGFEDSALDMATIRTAPPAELRRIMGTMTRIREDLDIPVMVVNSESETSHYAAVRQPDAELFRFWEVAGSSHMPLETVKSFEGLAVRDFGSRQVPIPETYSHVSWLSAHDAALQHVDRWVKHGTPPPVQSRIELQSGSTVIARDEDGLAIGGVRTPEMDVPVARNDGTNNGLYGHNEPFSAEKLLALYPTHQAYVDKVTTAAQEAAREGVILPALAEDYIGQARVANVPPMP